MSGLIKDIEGEAKKTEEWVEKEAGVIVHRVEDVYYHASAIGKKIDDWFAKESQTLESAAVEDYKTAIAKIKGLF